MTKADNSRVRQAEAIGDSLRRVGYNVYEQRRDWAECLLRFNDEHWFGRGFDRLDALEAALADALPSRLGQELFRARLSATDDGALEAGVSQSSRDPVTVPNQQLEAGGEANLDDSTVAFAYGQRDSAMLQDESTPVARETHETGIGMPADAAVESLSLSDYSTAAKGERAESLVRRVERLPQMSPEEAIQELAELRNLVEEDRLADFAKWNQRRQRLFLLEAIARGRAIAEAAGDTSEVTSDLSGLAGFLSELAGRYWPGSVSALKRDHLATDHHPELELPPEKAPMSWYEVAECAEHRGDQVCEQEGGEGADEEGWWDKFETLPASPMEMLREVSGELVSCSGPLEVKAGTQAGRREGRIRSLSSEALLRLARQLRWLRHADLDPQDWGKAMGRVRYLAEQAYQGSRAIADALNPRYSPSSGWAKLLGVDPDKRRRQRSRKALFRELRETVDPDRDWLEGWLLRAFDLEVETPRLRSLLLQHAELLREMTPGGRFDSRQRRRRLKRLQDALFGEAKDVSPVVADEPDSDDDGLLASSCLGRDQDEVSTMLEQVLPHTKGRVALLLTNRADPHQDEMLLETFGFGELRHEVTSKSRLGSIRDSVRNGGVELVLVATGFQGHATDRMLKPAADQANVPYVRLYKARRLACIKALHRDFVG